MTYCRIKWCPFCDQGWVIIVREISTQKLYCCCDECETEWNNPQNCLENIHYSVNQFGRYEKPTYEEISKLKWDKFILE